MFSCAQREKRVKKKGEEKRREKNFLSSSSFSSLFSGKTKTRDLLCGFCKKKKEKKSRVTHQNQRKKKEKKTIIKYIPRARVEMSKRLQVQRRKRPRGGYTKRVRRLFWWSVFISHVCATFTAQTEHVFFLFLLCSKEEKKICPLPSRSLSFSCLKTTQQKREEKRRNENEKKLIKKNIIKNVAARALRKTSVLSFRVHHARDIFVMNRWRSSVFFIWTRMYLYITVYPPLLFCLCFFSSSSSSCFFGTLAKEVFAFSIKKRERKRRAFFCVSRPSLFSSFPAPLKETKKKSSFFSSTIWREQTNERECVAEIEKYDRRKSPKRRRSIEEGTFPFLLCRFVFLFMLFRFERRERKGNHQKSPKKERKNSLVGPKNSGSSSSSSFFCSKNASRQRTKGVTK